MKKFLIVVWIILSLLVGFSIIYIIQYNKITDKVKDNTVTDIIINEEKIVDEKNNQSKIEITFISDKSLNIINEEFTVRLWGYDPRLADQSATLITERSYTSNILPFSFDFFYPSNSIEHIEPEVIWTAANYYIWIDWDNDRNGKINNWDISFDWGKQFPNVELVEWWKETIYLKQISDF